MKTITILLLCFILTTQSSVDEHRKTQQKWKRKSIQDYNDADMERLFDQWKDEDEAKEDLEEEKLPEIPQFDANIMKNPEKFLQLSKKGRTLMTFVNLYGKNSEAEVEKITKLWQTSLWNNHIQAERYIIGDNRVMFMFKDGAQAWEAKEFLIEQESFDSITIENKDYFGKHRTKKDEL